MCEVLTMTSTPASIASFLIAASLSFPNGSESYSKVNLDIFHSCKNRLQTLNSYSKKSGKWIELNCNVWLSERNTASSFVTLYSRTDSSIFNWRISPWKGVEKHWLVVLGWQKGGNWVFLDWNRDHPGTAVEICQEKLKM